MKAKLTKEMYDQVPSLIADGLNRNQIAEKFGVTVETLQVQCSKRGISLRRKDLAPFVRRVATTNYEASPPTAPVITEWLRPELMRVLRERACERNTTPERLAGKLLRVICRDDLFDAVIDTGPHTYMD